MDRKSITLSIGASIVSDQLERLSPEMLVEAADRCVYHSKYEGRARAYWTLLDPSRPFDQPMHLVGDKTHHGAASNRTGAPGQQGTAGRSDKLESTGPSADRHLLDGYAKQISANMERLSYLQRLATEMTFFDPSDSLEQVAKSVLPDLRHVISAQAVALVMADRSVSGETEEVGGIAVWDGSRVVDDQAIRALIEHFRPAAEQRPVVKNRLRHNRSGVRFPELDSLIIVRIVEQKATVGWLLALQRIPPSEIYESGAGWELNDFEFGTDEAGPIGATATLLGLHHRQSQMQKKIDDASTPTITLDATSDVSSFASVLDTE